jgi:hypothetical protein
MKRVLLLFCLSLLVLSCAKDDKPTSLKLDPATLTLHTLEQFVLVALDAAGEKINGQSVEWTSSNPETVAVWAGGSVKAKQIGKAVITAKYKNETTTCEVTVEPNVYLAGFQDPDGMNRTATYWKNGQAIALTDQAGNYADAWSICVDQGNIYVAGQVFSGNSAKAIYWKNGVGVLLSNGSSKGNAESIFVDQGNVYVAGWDDMVAKYWKDGVPTVLSNNATARAIYVANNNVYVAGMKYPKGVYWVNGQEFILPADGVTYIKAIYVSGNDVYVAGEVITDQKKPVAQYWKNGVPVALTEGKTEASLNSIWIYGTDIYAAGSEQDVRGVNHAKYWKNGVPTALDGEEATGITVAKGQIYVSGWEVVSNEMTLAKYWRNDKAVAMPNTGYSFVGATSIFVK